MNPVLLTREIGYRSWRGVRRRAVAGNYRRLVAGPAGPTELRPLQIELDEVVLAGPEFSATLTAVRESADAALRGEVDLLGSGPTVLPDPIDWHADFRSGYRWPADPYDEIEVTRLDDSSDAKVPWELSRGHQLLALARATRVFGGDAYARRLSTLWEGWLDANPAGVGINWANPMEVAIRAVNWAWALSLLPPDAIPEPLRVRIVAALRVHARHVAWNLEGTPRLRSNHYLADVLGLLVVGAVLTGREADRWHRRGRRAIEREMQRQVLPDGVGFEASVGYHGLCLEMFLIASWVVRARGAGLSRAYDSRLAAMVEASRSLTSAAGLVPRFGDSDDGRILPLGDARPASHQHLLWTAAAVAGTAPPADPDGAGEAALNFGTGAWAEARSRPAAAPPGCVELPHGGLWALRGGRAELFARCGDVGQNGNGGHAHNDLCAYELHVDGRPVVVDPGTFTYTADPAARNAFRSTGAHATAEVGGEEINPLDRERLFELRPLARPSRLEWDVSPRTALLRVSHDGYRRLPQGVVHERRFVVDRLEDSVQITDVLSGEGTVDAVIRIPLAPGAELSANGDDSVVRVGTVAVRVAAEGAAARISEGWVSASYGRRSRAPVLELVVSGELPIEVGHRIEVLA